MTAIHSPLFFDLRQVATLLGINYSAAWSLVTTRQLRALQIGRRWKVPQASIDAFVTEGTEAAQRRAQSHQQLHDHIGGRKWQSANAAKPGGSTSPRQAGIELDNRLRQLTGRRPRNSTTN
ncbi:helix-turn-helix domain-containing protein [Sphaerotilaceae bacterium SBD11-9]